MTTQHKFLATLVAATLSVNAAAFDVTTHAAMTSEAIKALKPNQTRNLSGIAAINQKLGLYDKDDVIKQRYIDMGASPSSRNGTAFENGIMDEVRRRIADVPAPYTVSGWIIRGAIREDDNTKDTPQGTHGGAA